MSVTLPTILIVCRCCLSAVGGARYVLRPGSSSRRALSFNCVPPRYSGLPRRSTSLIKFSVLLSPFCLLNPPRHEPILSCASFVEYQYSWFVTSCVCVCVSVSGVCVSLCVCLCVC